MEAGVVEIEHVIPWVVEPSHSGHRHTVAELLPDGHERYLRLFHPFVPWSAKPELGPVDTRVRWQALAAQAGTPFTGTTTWQTIEPVLPDDGEGRPWAVWEGHLEAQTAHDLYGALDDGETGPYYFEFGLAAVIETDDHRPRLYRSPSLEGRHQAVSRVRDHGAGRITTPSLSWNHEQRWITCSDYDLTSTYIATDAATASRLLAEPDLEIVEVRRSTRIDNCADERST